MSGRPWTQSELDLLRDNYGEVEAADFADTFGRSLSSVYQRAKIIGVAGAQKKWTRSEVATLRRLNAQGWTDTKIAVQLGRDRHIVGERRKRLGLRSNGRGELWVQAIREGVQRQCERLGVSRVTELRTRAFRNFAIESGWPEDLRPREVQILNVLAAQGVPMTRLELAGAIGTRTDRMGANGTLALLASCNGPGGTYTASLMRRGLLAKIQRGATVRGQGKGRSRDLYYLSANALTILEARACQ